MLVGNCLFNALSDQIKGDQSHHQEIRSRVIEYMREHSDYYKQFIDVNPGGGVRRNPKRKNAGAFSTPASTVAPTQEEIDRVFEAHLAQMSKGGTYGDNMEIVAFSAAFGVDVKIYQREVAFMVSGSEEQLLGGTERPIAHIAYHVSLHLPRNLSTSAFELWSQTLTRMSVLGALFIHSERCRSSYRSTQRQRNFHLSGG